MTDEKRTTRESGKVLDEEQTVVLQNIATLGTGRTKGRAMALLALNEGTTRAEACARSGLSLGQVKYVLATFQQRGMAMFDRYSFSEPQSVEVTEEKQSEPKKVKVSKKKPKKEEKPKKKGKKKSKKDKKPQKDKKKKPKPKAAKAKKGKKGKGKVAKKKGKKK